MSRQITPLTEIVSVQPRFLRSANLVHDAKSARTLEGYVLTSQARQALQRIVAGVSGDGVSRSWTLTGPYGSGKSSFSVYLTHLLGGGDHSAAAHQLLATVDEDLATRVRSAKRGRERGFLPILATGHRASVTLSLLEGLHDSLSQVSGSSDIAKIRREIKDSLRAARDGHTPSSRIVTEWLRRAATGVTSSRCGCAGLLIIIDELGKPLEYAAHHPKEDDVYVLQEVAELANRSSETPILFVGILHQAFEQYAVHLGAATRAEWSKIQGRFEDVAFQEPPDQMMRLLAQALASGKQPADLSLNAASVEAAEMAIECGLCPPAMSKEEFADIATCAYPLHPTTLVALPHLFRRFAQNERSLFSYLAAREPHGFREFVETHEFDPDGTPPFIRLPTVFDYFVANLGASLHTQFRARRWTKAVDALDRCPDLDSAEVELVKTIGLLGTLGDMSPLDAQQKMLILALETPTRDVDAIQRALDSLRSRSLVTYRRFSDTYVIWEGSDIDLEERLVMARRKVSGQMEVAADIERYLSPRPLVARRHSYRTGTLRYFDVTYVDRYSYEQCLERDSAEADGRVICCVPITESEVNDFDEWARSVDRDDVVVAVPCEVVPLGEALIELRSLHWVNENTPEVRDDRALRRELAERIGEVQSALLREIEQLLDPRPQPYGRRCRWYHLGQIQTHVRTRRDVAALLSSVCDHVYPATPHIWNELINRRSLSSAGAAARNKLLDAMLTRADEPQLGIEGYPPERSMYESLLRATGIHRQLAGRSAWGFSPPHDGTPKGVAAVWAKMESVLSDADMKRITVADLYAQLRRPPFGMLDGPLPVFLCALLQHHSAEIALYEDGSFVPELDKPVFERLVKDPSRFELQRCQIEGVRAAVLERLSDALARTEGKGKEVRDRAALVEIVRQLCRFAARIPPYSRRTARVSEPAQRVRRVLLQARDPYELLFNDLPRACELSPFQADVSADRAPIDEFFLHLRGAFDELQSAYDKLLLDVECLLIDAFSLSEKGKGARELLRKRAGPLVDYCVDSGLKAFLLRLADAQLSQANWIEAIATLLTRKPPKNWFDADLAHFEMALADVRRSVLHLERLAMERHQMAGDWDGTEIIRVGVTTLDAPERERVLFVSAEQSNSVEDLTQQLLSVIKSARCAVRHEVILAALARVTHQQMEEGEDVQIDEARADE